MNFFCGPAGGLLWWGVAAPDPHHHQGPVMMRPDLRDIAQLQPRVQEEPDVFAELTIAPHSGSAAKAKKIPLTTNGVCHNHRAG